jgi:hypothetical protein
VSENLK